MSQNIFTSLPIAESVIIHDGMKRGVRRREELFQTKKGKEFWVEITYTPVKVDGAFKYCLANWIDITERKRLRENMQYYIAEVTRAQEEERKRIARELHDETAQSLVSLYRNLATIIESRDELSEAILRRLEQLRADIDDIMGGVRRFSHELRPEVLDHLGLMPVLRLLTSELNKEGELSARLTVIGSERRLSPEAELVLFRIVQEALGNIRKHSKATEALVKVQFAKKEVKLSVIDNGSGFKLPEVLGDFARKGKLGLIGMRERINLLGGSFAVESGVGEGTKIAVEMPS